MGMFDEIVVKKTLPLPKEVKKLPIKWNEHKFQTKDLENCLLEYFVDKKGELFEVVIEREYIEWSEEEKRSKDFCSWNIYKDSKEISRHNKKVEYHGIIRFYDYFTLDPENDAWLEFEAYFSYGKLDKIELKEFRKEPSHSLKLEEWQQELQERQKTLSYKTKQLANKFGYKKTMLILARMMNRLASFFTKIQWKIYKHTS